MNKKQLAYTYPENERIFSVEENVEYHIATGISDKFIENNELCLEIGLSNYQKGTLRFSIFKDEIVRMKFSSKYFPENKFKDHIELKNFDLPKFFEEVQEDETTEAAEVRATVSTKNTGTKGNNVKTNKIWFYLKNKTKKFVITKRPFNIEIIDSKTGESDFSLNYREGFKYFGGFTAPAFGYKQYADDKFHPFLSFKIENNESIYGLGEKFGPVEKNGTLKTIWNSDTSGKMNSDLSYSAIPFVVSTKNWGLLLDTGTKSTFDIGHSVVDAGSILNFDNNLDLYFFSGNNIKEIISDYTKLTGKITKIPDQAYGIWFSRLYYHDFDEAMHEVEQSEKNDLKIDVIHIDPKWIKNRYTKSCNFVEATERFGDFKKMFEKFEKKNIAISFWLNPYIQSDDSDFWKHVSKNNFLVKSSNEGQEFAHPYTGVETYQTNNYIIDLTNPKAFDFWKESLKKLIKKGLKFTVVDYGDGVPEDAVFYNGLNGKEMRQYSTFLYRKVVSEAFEEVLGKGKTVGVARPGYIGAHKFPGKWAGDSGCRWTEMKIALQGGLSLAMNAEMFWGTDIGGFIGTPTNELYSQWIKFGAFTPFTRIHGLTKREPWYFGNEITEVMKKYFGIKRMWLPEYKYGELIASKVGTPIMRAMVLENQSDIIARKIDDQYYINENVLVAPYMNKYSARQIYFPEGKWTNYFDNTKQYNGKTLIDFESKSEDLPVFIKQGTILATIENQDFDYKNIDKETIIITAFLGQENKGTKEFYLNDKLVKINYSISLDKAKIEVEGHKKYKINLIKSKLNDNK